VSHEVPGVDADNDGFNDGDTNHDAALNVGETWQFAFTHTVAQGEIDNGGIVDPSLTIDNTPRPRPVRLFRSPPTRRPYRWSNGPIWRS